MALRKIKDELINDIKERGVSIRWQNGESSFGFKRNESIGELVKTHYQMLRILNNLKLIPPEGEVDPKDLEM